MILEVILRAYTEFNPNAWLVQPWNTLSSLSFFIPVLYWFKKLRGEYKTYPILAFILPLIALNGLGSTLFHGNNGGMAFLLLDVVPPFIMMLSLSLYFWKRITKRWVYAILIVVGFIVLNLSNRWYLWTLEEYALSINLFYVINALMVLIPLIGVLMYNQWKGTFLLLSTVLFLAVALLFRFLDQPSLPSPEFFPQGTHFLWHIFSAVAVFPLGKFLIELRDHNSA